MRARESGIVIGGGTPGRLNAITDVPGVLVGHTTLTEGDGPLRVGSGPVRTGVTVVLPPGPIWEQPLFAGWHRLNGNGELTGLEWVRESGMLTSPIGLTNTHSVGVVRDALVATQVDQRGAEAGYFWCLPVVGETWDGMLNDINGFHVRPEHVSTAIAAARRRTGRRGQRRRRHRHDLPRLQGRHRHRFAGTAAGRGRLHGRRAGAGQPRSARALCGQRRAGRARRSAPTRFRCPTDPDAAAGSGSIIVIVATDAPLLPHQCTRLAQRAGARGARTGGVGEHTSGDLFFCFATGNRGMTAGRPDPARAVDRATGDAL